MWVGYGRLHVPGHVFLGDYDATDLRIDRLAQGVKEESGKNGEKSFRHDCRSLQGMVLTLVSSHISHHHAMSALSSIIEEVAAAAEADTVGSDPKAHTKLLQTIQKLTLAAERPSETIKRILYQVSISGMVAQNSNR